MSLLACSGCCHVHFPRLVAGNRGPGLYDGPQFGVRLLKRLQAGHVPPRCSAGAVAYLCESPSTASIILGQTCLPRIPITRSFNLQDKVTDMMATSPESQHRHHSSHSISESENPTPSLSLSFNISSRPSSPTPSVFSSVSASSHSTMSSSTDNTVEDHYFSSNSPPGDLPKHEALARDFIAQHSAAGRRVVLITSGGTTVPLERNTVRFSEPPSPVAFLPSY